MMRGIYLSSKELPALKWTQRIWLKWTQRIGLFEKDGWTYGIDQGELDTASAFSVL